MKKLFIIILLIGTSLTEYCHSAEKSTRSKPEITTYTISATRPTTPPTTGESAACYSTPCREQLGNVTLKCTTRDGVKKGCIVQLYTNATYRDSVIGTLLFLGTLEFLINQAKVSKIVWTARPLEDLANEAKLISFYEKRGGEIVTLHNDRCGADMQLRDENFAKIKSAMGSSTSNAVWIKKISGVELKLESSTTY